MNYSLAKHVYMLIWHQLKKPGTKEVGIVTELVGTVNYLTILKSW